MYAYQIRFYGRLLGAIGIFYWITDTVIADTKEEAVLELYKKYGSVQQPEVLKCFDNS